MRMIEEYRTTSNHTVYKRLRKMVLENNALIYCSKCPYHKVENLKNWRPRKNWKITRRYQCWDRN